MRGSRTAKRRISWATGLIAIISSGNIAQNITQYSSRTRHWYAQKNRRRAAGSRLRHKIKPLLSNIAKAGQALSGLPSD